MIRSIRDIINAGDLVTPDGIGLIYGSKIKKKNFKGKGNGF